jgi:hypothetical protein
MDWNKLHWTNKFLILSGETSVEIGLLTENKTLLQMIKENKSQEECLDFINQEF